MGSFYVVGRVSAPRATIGGVNASLPAGTVLGHRYRLVRLIGHGGMGSVYEALQTDLGRRVAVKVLDTRLSFEAAHVERFRREAHAAAMLGHPNIVQVTDFQSNPGEPPFLVMDFLDGQSLAQRIERHGCIDARHAALVGVQVLDALGAAHRAGIVHRDIKPDNLFLVQVPAVGEIVKVLDFGVAKLSDAPPSSAPLTATGAMLGTPAYMAPEQARGAAIDARADLYALGASLYHALAGTMPFTANSAPALLFAIVEQMPPPLVQLRPDLPHALVAIIERAMAKDPAARFQSADEMRAALAPFAQVSAASSVVVTPAPGTAPSAYAVTMGTHSPMIPGRTPQPLAPGVIVPSGIPVVMGQPTFGGVAQRTPHPATAPRTGGAAAVVRNIFLGIIGILLALGLVAAAIIYVAKGKPSTATETPTAATASAAATGAAATATATASATTATATAAAGTTTTTATGGARLATASATIATGTAPAPFGKFLTGVPIDLNPTLPPAPTSAPHPFSGAKMIGGGSTGIDIAENKSCSACDISAFLAQIPPAGKIACYAASQWEPPEHEDRGFFFAFDATGKITNVWREPTYPPVPRIDACLAKLIFAARMPMKAPMAGFGEVSMTSECDPGWHNHCAAINGAGGGQNAAQQQAK